MPSEPLAPSYFAEKTFRSTNATLLKKIVATEKDPASLQGMGKVKEAQELFEAGKIKEARALAEKTKRIYRFRLARTAFYEDYKKIIKACQDLLDKIDSDGSVQADLSESEAACCAKRLASLEK